MRDVHTIQSEVGQVMHIIVQSRTVLLSICRPIMRMRIVIAGASAALLLLLLYSPAPLLPSSIVAPCHIPYCTIPPILILLLHSSLYCTLSPSPSQSSAPLLQTLANCKNAKKPPEIGSHLLREKMDQLGGRASGGGLRRGSDWLGN